jgi:VanZ family protein
MTRIDPRVKLFVVNAFRIASWLLAVAIVVLSLVPASLRPETDVPHDFEHFAIFVATGIAFGIGYGRRPGLVTLWLVIFAGAIELAQFAIPDRHARLSDFIVDALAACVGLVIARYVAQRTLAKGV